MYSKYGKYYRLNNGRHDWGDNYDHFMSMKIITLIRNEKLILIPTFVREMGTCIV